MTEPVELSPELQRVADLLSEQPLAVRELFRYALVLAMIDDEKINVTNSRIEGDRECLTVRTTAGALGCVDTECQARQLRDLRAISGWVKRHLSVVESKDLITIHRTCLSQTIIS